MIIHTAAVDAVMSIASASDHSPLQLLPGAAINTTQHGAGVDEGLKLMYIKYVENFVS